ncbi:HlyD family efflux transporter periplasmic adaptor subunit [Patescibacteria group bacterium]|nr:HlyD family efflux transporter periplasmic adaptor subunit [Patescibacteria group bacterium]MCL5797419.1 HlyD family efflux transporter periplasmic adaptor subunit [Patescibacteria group bacterium]
MAKRLFQKPIMKRSVRNLKKVQVHVLSHSRETYKKIRTEIKTRLKTNPLPTFFTILAAIFILIVASNFFTSPKTTGNTSLSTAKAVTVYTIGSAPTVTLEGQVEKSGVVTIVAQSSGIIQKIYKTEGQEVDKGNWIAYLSTNYQGGNLASSQRQLAQVQYQNILDTYDMQKGLIGKQRDLASKNADNSDQLRDIASQSVNDTQNLINLDQDILNSLNGTINSLSQSPSASNDAMIVSTKEIEAQVMAGLNQAQNQIKTVQYQTDISKSAAQIPDLQKDITLKQLDLQEKMLDLNRETARIQLSLAQISEGMMYPSAPFAGVIQKIFVRTGQMVNPGTPIAVLSAKNQQSAKITLYMTKELSVQISKLQDSNIRIGNENIPAKPFYISSDPVQGTLYAVTYLIPQEYVNKVTDKGYLAVDVPIGYTDTTSSDPFIPIDAVYQTSDSSYVYIDKDGKAVSQQVNLGIIYGRFIEVTKGLSDKDKIILDRTVIDGDPVTLGRNP